MADEAPPSYEQAMARTGDSPPPYREYTHQQDEPYTFVTRNDNVLLVDDWALNFTDRQWQATETVIYNIHPHHTRDGVDIIIQTTNLENAGSCGEPTELSPGEKGMLCSGRSADMARAESRLEQLGEETIKAAEC